MASAAQISANRSNAQKSTGPWTPEGKAVVAQNAVKHGLLAREGVLRGEDAEEFERHREMLLEQLNPAGALEVILATRIVDLTWRPGGCNGLPKTGTRPLGRCTTGTRRTRRSRPGRPNGARRWGG